MFVPKPNKLNHFYFFLLHLLLLHEWQKGSASFRNFCSLPLVQLAHEVKMHAQAHYHHGIKLSSKAKVTGKINEQKAPW